jgi:hypothetical protein
MPQDALSSYEDFSGADFYAEDGKNQYFTAKRDPYDQRDDISNAVDTVTTHSSGSPSICREDDVTYAGSYSKSRVSEARHSAQRVLEEAARESEEMLKRQQERKAPFHSPQTKRSQNLPAPLSTRSSREPLNRPRSPPAYNSPSARSESGMRHARRLDEPEDSLSMSMEKVRLQSRGYENEELRQQVEALEVLLKDKELDWKKKVRNLESQIVELCKDRQAQKVNLEKEIEVRSEKLSDDVEQLQIQARDLEKAKKENEESAKMELTEKESELKKLEAALKQKHLIIDSLQGEKRILTDSAKSIMDEARREIKRLKEDHSEETEHMMKSLEFEFNQKMRRLEDDADQLESGLREKSNTIKELEKEIAQHQKAVLESEKRKNIALEEKDVISKELQTAQDSANVAKSDASRLTSQNASLQADNQTMSREKVSMTQHIESLEHKNRDLAKELNTMDLKHEKNLAAQEHLEARASALEDETAKFRSECQDAGDQLKKVQEELKKTRRELSVIEDDCNASLGKKDREIGDLSNSLNFQKEKVLEMKADMTNMRHDMEIQVRSLEKDLQKKKRDLSEAMERAAESEDEVAQVRNEIQHLLEQNSALKADISEAGAALERSREKAAYAESLEEELKGMDANLSCLKREVVSLGEDKQKLAAELIEERRETNTLKAGLSKLEQDVEDSQHRREEDEQKIRRLYEDNDKLQVANGNMLVDISSLKSSLTRAEAELTAIPDLERLLAESEKTTASVRRECDTIRAENIAGMREIKAELSQMRQENQQLQDRAEIDRSRNARNEALMGEMNDEINQRDDVMKELETRIEIEKRSNSNLARDVKELSMQLEESAEANRLGEKALRQESRENEMQFEEQDKYVDTLLKEIESFKEERSEMQRELRLLRDDVERYEHQAPTPQRYVGSSSPQNRLSQARSRSVAPPGRDFSPSDVGRYGGGSSVSGTPQYGEGRRYGANTGNRSVAASSRPGYESVRSTYDAESRQEHPMASPSTYGGRGSRQFRY